MAKVLISLIGTGRIADGDKTHNRYEVTDYLIDGKLYKNNSFSSLAIIEHFGIERVYFLGTKDSMWDNLADVFEADEEYILNIIERKDEDSLSEKDLEKLGEFIDKKLHSQGSKCFIVEKGENEEELWSIFDKFLEILENLTVEDEVYLDITHLFRSHSVLSFVFTEFGRNFKQFRIGGIFYAMLKIGEPSLIINVKVFFELLEWAKAIEEIEEYASFRKFAYLVENKLPRNVNSVVNELRYSFDIVYMSAIYNAVNRLKNHLNYFKESEFKIIKILSPRLEKFVDRLSKPKTLSAFQFELAKFFAEREIYSLAYISLAEAVVTFICEKQGLNPEDKENRDKAKEWIRYGLDEVFPYGHPRKKFANLYVDQISKIRNNICHQLNTTKNAKIDSEHFNLYFEKSRKFLKEFF